RDYRRKLKLDYPQALEGCFFLLESLVNLSTANPQHRLLRGLLLEKIELLEGGIPETDRNVEFISAHIERLSTELNLAAARPANQEPRPAHAGQRSCGPPRRQSPKSPRRICLPCSSPSSGYWLG